MINGNLSLSGKNPAFLTKKFLAPLVPYITVGIGLLVLHNAWAAMLGYHLGMIIILLLVRPDISVKQLLRSRNYKIPLITGLLGASGGILLYVLWPLLAIPQDINLHVQNIGLNQVTWPIFLAYFILINPWMEEYYWRGYLGSNTRCVSVTDVLFSGYHLVVLAGKMDVIWLVAIFLILTAGAWFWRQANRWGRGLLPSAISHLAADFTVIFAIYFMVIRA